MSAASARWREAARLMRERAEAATPSPWRDSAVDGNRYAAVVSDVMPEGRKPGGGWDDTEGYGGYLVGESIQTPDREHIAGWHPAVALAVAAMLEDVATDAETIKRSDLWREYVHATAVADAYLGSPA